MLLSAPRANPHVASVSRSYDVAALFRELDGETFRRYDELIDEVLARMNAHLTHFPVGYGYREALALAERRGWLATRDNGRSVTVTCREMAQSELAALAA